MLPQVGYGAGTPKPRNESDASVSILDANDSVALTIIIDIVFGNICLNIMFFSFIPSDLAATTYSCSLIESTCARTSL